VFELTSRPGGLAGILQDGPREPLFSVTDIDPETGKTSVTEYTIPVEFPPTAAMLYANIRSAGSDDEVATWALQLSLGMDGFRALCSLDVPREDFVKMLAIVVGKIQGHDISAPGAAAPKRTAAKSRKR